MVGFPFTFNAWRQFRFAALLSFGSLLTSVNAGQTPYCLSQTVIAPDGTENDYFGTATAMSDDTLVVGAPDAFMPGSPKIGRVYIFEREGTQWVFKQEFLQPGPPVTSKFGEDVAVDGDVVVASVRQEPDGKVYVYRRTARGWVLEQTIFSPESQKVLFGSNVGISGDWLFASGEQDRNKTGAIYVYKFNGTTFTLHQKIVPVGADGGDEVGRGLAVRGKCAVFGAPGATVFGPQGQFINNGGKAFPFREVSGTWVQEGVLTTWAPEGGDALGYSLAIDDPWIFAATTDSVNSGPIVTGTVHVFARQSDGTWLQTQQIFPPPIDSENGDEFGWSCDVRNGIAAVGSIEDSTVAFHAGAASLFTLNGNVWEAHTNLVVPGLNEVDSLGTAVATNGVSTAISAITKETTVPGAGVVYIVGADGVDCNSNGIPDVCDIESITSLDQDGNGVPDECQKPCVGDFNGDGVIDVLDLDILIDMWDLTRSEADLNADGLVDGADLGLLLGAWGEC